MRRINSPKTQMAKPAIQPIELDSADASVALQMTRWLTHLKSERRLSPKTLEAYARDLRQCLDFLCEHWGTPVTLASSPSWKPATSEPSWRCAALRPSPAAR